MRILKQEKDSYSSEKVSERYLELNSCGINGVESEDVLIVRENGRADFHFLYVFSGVCKVFVDGEEKRLQSGDVMLFHPHCEQRYYFEKTGKNKVYWAHFTGRATKEILCECKMLESGIYKVGYSDALLLHLDRMISEFRMHSSSAVCLSLLHSVFAEFCRLMMSGAFGGERREMILSIAQKMESNLTNDECIDDYAAECNLSRDRFVHLFKEVTGWSPYRYMLNIRMEKAERLLRFSSATVSEIALTLGFCDPLYFSRIFKKHVGVSPTEYRNNVK